jgi:hypothetical protein
LARFDWAKVGGGPPARDEPEVTIIGPGFGESIVVHVGDGRWMIVDSCIDAQAEREMPAAISYLESINVNPASQVDLVAATHWHRDHVRGLAEMVRRCPGARFACGAALLSDELLTYLVAIGSTITTLSAPKPQELLEAVRILRGREQSPRHTKAGQIVYTWPSIQCQAIALSPSDAEYQAFISRMAAMLPRPGEPKRGATAGDRNEVCVVLHVKWPEFSVLLGGDMVVTSAHDRGWSAVMQEHRQHGLAKSVVVKVPHHGSYNAHYEPMWRDGLDTSPISVIAPFGRGSKSTRPPTESDLNRIASLSGRAYVTSHPGGTSAARFDTAVERTLDEGGIEVFDANPPLGIVQLRRVAGAWRERLFFPASWVRRPEPQSA